MCSFHVLYILCINTISLYFTSPPCFIRYTAEVTKIVKNLLSKKKNQFVEIYAPRSCAPIFLQPKLIFTYLLRKMNPIFHLLNSPHLALYTWTLTWEGNTLKTLRTYLVNLKIMLFCWFRPLVNTAAIMWGVGSSRFVLHETPNIHWDYWVRRFEYCSRPESNHNTLLRQFLDFIATVSLSFFFFLCLLFNSLNHLYTPVRCMSGLVFL